MAPALGLAWSALGVAQAPLGLAPSVLAPSSLASSLLASSLLVSAACPPESLPAAETKAPRERGFLVCAWNYA